ncbi:hypothetical protein EIG75_16360 [Pseudomonas syringae]|uniref:Uncharacterized protein n=1 Tax=Pseudomonas syringae TaxID=317 RepID=A0A6B2B3R7_PSESX|nr:hypothetical protein [Pseudomonas syringae]MDC6490923.1 hypothetical protein [Pseudomonas syringae]MDC6500681.1 hypothetical protein [Pseudomonas syringae]MDC6511315.1 hypothetical protein [Pseudomonas syringae]MDC6532289.1 hypothetical protein [Pseudomonas syringae]MDC6553907.1 hypothetical protein [Pseudomonas syringae]
MTTNAFDRAKLMVTSDSRWSIPYPDDLSPTHVIYVDDTNFEKISTSDKATLVFAGDGILIDEWKTWFKNPDFAALPRTDRVQDNVLYDISICVVINKTGRISYDSGNCLMHNESARFAGSGAFHARDCFVQNACAIKAIGTAGAPNADPYTGGTTQYLELHTGVTNLIRMESTLQDAEHELDTRGQVMDLSNGKVTSLKEFLASRTDAQQALHATGVHLSAPTGHQSRKWTASEKEALRTALQEAMSDDHENAHS